MNLTLPDVYEENLFEYVPGIDNVPELIDLIPKGYTMKHCRKLHKLVSIEATKYTMKEAIEDGEITSEEIEYGHQIIAEMIEEYNNM